MADGQAKSRNGSARNKPILGIRARLVVLGLLIVAPLMLERVHALEGARTKRTESAQAELTDLARRGAEAQREIIYSTRALLQLIASVYARTPFDPQHCKEYLTDLSDNVPWIRALSIAGPDGEIHCTTEPLLVGLNISDRPHYQNAVQAHDFVLSDYLISRVDQTPSLIAAFPAVTKTGSVNGVILASIDLEWIADLATTAGQRPGSSVSLIDGNGMLVAASAEQRGLVGNHFADHALVQAMLANDQGTMTDSGLDGVRRIFAYIRVPWTQARLAVGLDESDVYAGIDRNIELAYLELVLVGIFVLLVAWFGGERLVVRPIRSLARTAARFGGGELDVRATEETWLAEFEPLAVALDDMARKLATREEELRVANQHLDELASLDGLTGLANRRGFDRQLDREWRRAAEQGEPVALMMVDIDHFKLYNDRYGHVSGDACLHAVGETLSLIAIHDAVMVARYGGEEFGLLLPGLCLERAKALAETARRAIEDLVIAHSEAPGGLITISIGVESVVPQKHQPAGDLVEAADSALYIAKGRGRNRVVAHPPMPLSKAS
jgi:diguanylate cyclase (GGDEF)-like protein